MSVRLHAWIHFWCSKLGLLTIASCKRNSPLVIAVSKAATVARVWPWFTFAALFIANRRPISLVLPHAETTPPAPNAEYLEVSGRPLRRTIKMRQPGLPSRLDGSSYGRGAGSPSRLSYCTWRKTHPASTQSRAGLQPNKALQLTRPAPSINLRQSC